ncbi:hypothetical protein ACFQ3Y_24865 [Paenibacillus motobuensis]|uniref:hypothetical protein n=1 Tax=Paenibacillus motobuensis TaxID=295324 RepID=UPI003640E2EA
MAKLVGVLKTDQTGDDVIYYDGVEYVKTEGPVQFGDILRCIDTDFLADISLGGYYLVNIQDGGVIGFLDDVGDSEGVNGGLDYDISYAEHKFTVFRRVETPQTPAEIRTAIETKRGEIAELEAKLADLSAIKLGDWVRVVADSHNGYFHDGDILRVIAVDDTVIPYQVKDCLRGARDWTCKASVVKITADEAKAALIAKVEEAFKEAKTSAS